MGTDPTEVERKGVLMRKMQFNITNVPKHLMLLTTIFVATTYAIERVHAQASLPVNYGELVHTFEAPNDLQDPLVPQSSPVVTLVDSTPFGLGGAILGTNFLAPLYWNSNGGTHAWTEANLGQIYGVTLDGATNPNIYVTAAGLPIYASGTTVGPLGPTGVYRLDGTTGAICPLIALPRDTTSSGLGNIVYSSLTNTIYVSNFDDGLIYQIPLSACPVPPLTFIPTYDHGVTGRVAYFGIPLAAIPDNGASGITALGRRVWGLAVNTRENRLYYGVWWEDVFNPHATERNEIWSVPLSPTTGVPLGALARREFIHTTIFSGSSCPAAGLNFSPIGTLLVAERGPYQIAHYSRLIEYVGGTGSWTPHPTNTYLLGVNTMSCAGGGEMEWNGKVWSTADSLIRATDFIYGLTRMPAGGNAADTSPWYVDRSILIDSDQKINDNGDKNQIGTLVYRRTPCAIPPANMVMWMPFDESSGITTNNFARSFANGSVNAGAGFGPGTVGNAICFDGGHVSVPYYSAQFLNVNLTIDAWINPTSIGATWEHTIVDKRQLVSPGIWRGYRLYVTGLTPSLNLEIHPGTGAPLTSTLATSTLAYGTWHHVAVTVDRICPTAGQVCVNFWVDGVMAAGTPATFFVPGIMGTSFGTSIGDDIEVNNNRWFAGCIDELEMFDRALSDYELQTIYAAGPQGKCKVYWLVCPWDINHDLDVDFFDYIDFVNLFLNGSWNSDFNSDGTIDFFDYLDFVDGFASGSC